MELFFSEKLLGLLFDVFSDWRSGEEEFVADGAVEEVRADEGVCTATVHPVATRCRVDLLRRVEQRTETHHTVRVQRVGVALVRVVPAILNTRPARVTMRRRFARSSPANAA